MAPISFNIISLRQEGLQFIAIVVRIKYPEVISIIFNEVVPNVFTAYEKFMCVH